MADDDPFLLQDTPLEDWRKAGNEPDLQLPLPTANGSEESGGTMLFRRVPAGSFLMGSRDEFKDNQPVHRVRVREFWMGKFVVTQAQWKAMPSDGAWSARVDSTSSPSPCHGDNTPVGQVSWDDAQAWLKTWQAWLDGNPEALTKAVGLPAGFAGKVLLRLPCEAEWEYACRAGGRAGSWYDGVVEVCRQGASQGSAGTVARADVPVAEWCMDRWDEGAYRKRTWGWIAESWSLEGTHNLRSIRGGLIAGRWRSGGRYPAPPSYRHRLQGFRVCVTLAHETTSHRRPNTHHPSGVIVDWTNPDAPPFWNLDQIHVEQVLKLSATDPGSDRREEPGELSERLGEFESLRELHLWNVLGIETLPPLPQSIRVLDLIGCEDLETLSDVPPSAHTVDLGHCVRLRDFGHLGGPGLRMLHLDGCNGLDSFILHDILRKSPNLEELTASNCEGLREIKYLPTTLRRLVLSSCSELVALPDLSGHRTLTDIDIRNCKSLKTLTGLHIDQGAGVQRLFAYGCESLREFNGFDVRPVHLGEGEETNVAATFRTMERLWHSRADLVMGKVLFLGGGRCGKTTLAKAFQWQGMSEIERTQRPELNPMDRSPSTHGIHFWRWTTQFSTKEPCDGEVHLWDFGGQEVYHNTHRMFASEGSVFLIATTSRAEHERRRREDIASEGLRQDEAQQWNEQNEFREVRYWLDYLRSVLGIESVQSLGDRLRTAGRHPRLFVQIVYTGSTSHDVALEDLLAQSGPYRGLLEDPDSGLRVAVYDRAKPDGLKPILKWVQSSLGQVADALGIRTLKLFKDMADRVTVDLEREGDPSAHAQLSQRVLSFDEWKDWAACSAPIAGSGEEAALLRAEQATAAAEYLHRCGRIFWLGRKTARSSIILNHQWAADIIYSLFNRKAATHWGNETGQLMSEEQVRRLLACVRVYQQCKDDQKDRFLDILHDCRVCVRVGEEQWMAMQRDLLPRQISTLDRELVGAWEGFQRTWIGDWVNHSFAIHAVKERLLGHEDFRSVVRALVEERHRSLPRILCAREKDDGGFGWAIQPSANSATVRLWETGLQMELRAYGRSAEHADVVMIRVEWMPRMEQSADGSTTGRLRQFNGGIFVQLLTRDEKRHGDGLRTFLRQGPLHGFGDGLDDKQDLRTQDLPKADMAHLRGRGQPGWRTGHGPRRPDVYHDVAISYRWGDWDTVQPLVEALEKANVHFYIDRQDEKRRLGQEDRGSRITEIYDYLKRARMLIVVASNLYFEEPQLESSRNLYCPVELADAVNALAGSDSKDPEQSVRLPPHRPAGNLFWVMAPSFDGNKLRDGIERVIESYRTNVIEGRGGNPRDPMSEWEGREMETIHAADRQRVNTFVDRVVGPLDLRFEASSSDWVSKIVERIGRVLDRP